MNENIKNAVKSVSIMKESTNINFISLITIKSLSFLLITFPYAIVIHIQYIFFVSIHRILIAVLLCCKYTRINITENYLFR